MKASPGCLRTDADRYRPVVVEERGSIYFSHETFERSAQAVQFAAEAIEDKDFSTWHSHHIVTE